MNNKLTITHNLIKELEDKLRHSEKKNYKGLSSVAMHLVNYYFVLHEYNEYTYFTHYKAISLFIELRSWLASIYGQDQKFEAFDIEKINTESELFLLEIKVDIINNWKKNKLNRLIKDCKKTLKQEKNKYFVYRRKLYLNMLKTIVEKYPKYTKANLVELLEELGVELV